MRSGTLKKIRLATFVLVFALAGFYASNYFALGSRDAPPDSNKLDAAPSREALPDFTLNDLAGKPRNITEWSDRPMLINFWATWCGPCRREMPLLEALHQERRDDPLTVIGIAIDRWDDVASYVPESGVTYPILVGQAEAMELASMLDPQFTAMPFTVFTVPGGHILTLFTGELHPKQLREILAVVDAVSEQQLTLEEGRRRLSGTEPPPTY